MAFDFSTLITDRSQGDLDALRDLLNTPISDWTAEQLAEFNQAASKGAYNYTDLNRVTAAMEYLVSILNSYGYSVGYKRIKIEHAQVENLLPDGYTQLEYIESTGQQYIDTGVKPDQDTGVEITAQYTTVEAWASLFGTRNGANSGQYVLWPSSANAFRYDFGNQSTLNIEANATNKLEYLSDGPYIYIGDNSSSYPSGQQFLCNYNLYLLTLNNAGASAVCSKVKLFLCKISSQENLLRNFIPCISDTGEVGLYDTVEGVFYGNSGTGEFLAGPTVSGDSNTLPEPLDPYTWYASDVPTAAQMNQYLANVAAIREALAEIPGIPNAPDTMDKLTYESANNIEKILSNVEVTIDHIIHSVNFGWAIGIADIGIYGGV